MRREQMALSLIVGAAMAVLVAGESRGIAPGLLLRPYADGFTRPVALKFAPDGRLFVAEQSGRVYIVQNRVRVTTPFIDLRQEVNGNGDRGMLGIELDPNFAVNGYVYLLYVVDPVAGEPDETSGVSTFARLTRYTANPATGGMTADLNSRLVLLGNSPADGFATCRHTHSIGTVRFAFDGSLFVGAGDGGYPDSTDWGGQYPGCFGAGMFDPSLDIGSFRSQYLWSMNGKILRIDSGTGQGLADNPYWTGNGSDIKSKVWVSGLRNPCRFELKPGSGPIGTLYIGDVGWQRFEELDVALGGENFGWPCYEGFEARPEYQSASPAHSGCGTIGTAENPGPLTMPKAAYHPSNGALSVPAGLTGRCVIGGEFYEGVRYPAALRDKYFFGDYRGPSGASFIGWIKAAEMSVTDTIAQIVDVTATDRVVDLAIEPSTGDVVFAQNLSSSLFRLAPVPGDCSGDGIVNGSEVACFEGCYSPGSGSVAGNSACSLMDFDEDGDVDCVDWWRLSEASGISSGELLLPSEAEFAVGLVANDLSGLGQCRLDANVDGRLDGLDVGAYLARIGF